MATPATDIITQLNAKNPSIAPGPDDSEQPWVFGDMLVAPWRERTEADTEEECEELKGTDDYDEEYFDDELEMARWFQSMLVAGKNYYD